MNEPQTPRDIDNAEARKLLSEAKPPALLDVREPQEIEAHGRIPDSIHIPMRQVPDRTDELDPARPLLVYCAGGVRSYDVGCFLLQKGFRDVMNLEGGIASWDGEIEHP